MKKIIILSLMLACQSLYAAPASKASAPAAKATQTSKAPAKKAEKVKPAADKKAEPVKAKKDKTSEKKATLAKADKNPKKPEKADKRKAVETKKAVAQKSEKSHDKAAAKNKNDKKVAAAKDKKHASAKTRDVAANGISSARSTLLNHGKKFIGTPYVWGGTSPKGFDCSGLVHYLYQKQGVSIPRNSREQFSRLPVASNPQPGDLVFFRRNGTINHVGLYLGGGKMLHAPQTGSKVRIEDMGRPNWKRRYAGARRALKGEKIVIAANRVTATSKNKEPNEKRLAKRAPNSKDSKAKVAAVVKKSKVVTARR
ncbi:C40 family peptidase [Cardiobacterium hominis]|uniref:NLP/P60 family protein n=1 Tax=Cardiobacterium hominis TaxID=2718 RepID=A0A1C3HP81_9GAMM|nr:C40 family peptidase [Cardiobacterium hominis]SAY97511.1 NLP/P60 family protein [Cardiobacterium hominis]